MKAVILAGGFGNRISEESYLKPKPMIESNCAFFVQHYLKLQHVADKCVLFAQKINTYIKKEGIKKNV